MKEVPEEVADIDHFPDSYWLGQNEDPMIQMLDFLEAGGSYEALPSQPIPKSLAMTATARMQHH